MVSLDPKPYDVRPGDTLGSIARKFGFSDWRDIYGNECNAVFRRQRSNPNIIQPHDRLLIPAKPNVVRVREETDVLFQQILEEMEDNIRSYERVASRSDIIATVGTLFVGLGKLVVEGVSAMKLSGVALNEANRELAKESLKFVYEPLRDTALKLAAEKIGAENGVVWAVGKTTIESWINIQSPSWWAGVAGNLKDGQGWSGAVTTNPLDELKATKESIERQRQETMSRIDQRIQETQKCLVGLGNESLLSLYDAGLPNYA